MLKKLLLVTCFMTYCVVCLLDCSAFGERYVVDSTTSSTNWASAEWTNYPSEPTCTPVTPMTAISNAIAGDIVYFRGGAGGNYTFPGCYWKTPYLNPANSGTEGNPITFRNYPSESPHLQNSLEYGETYTGAGPPGYPVCQGTFEDPLIGSRLRDWIVWDGFKLSAPDASGKVNFYDADNCTLQNTEIIGISIASGCPGNYDGVRIQNASYITIKNVIIRGVECVETNHGNGVKLYDSDHVTVENSTIYTCDSAIVDKDGGANNTYKLNYFYDIGTDGTGSVNIRIGEMADGPAPDNITIYQNIFDLKKSGGSGAFTSSQTSSDVSLYNNIVYGTGSSTGFWHKESTNIIQYNNIIVDTDDIIITDGANSTFAYSSYNLYYNTNIFVLDIYGTPQIFNSLSDWQSSGILIGGGNPGTNSISQNPLFEDPGNGNFHLQGNSPCIGTGKDGKDIGAYPNGDDGTIIGYVPAGLPKNLSPPQKPRIAE